MGYTPAGVFMLGETSKTDRASYLFRVKEYGDGSPWIMLESRDGHNLPCVGDGFLGFDLKPGTTYDQAKEIARFLNENLTEATHTWFLPKHLQQKAF